MDQHATDCLFVREMVSSTSCSCGFIERDAKRNFEEKHAIIHDDALTELKRRRSIWASCPDSRGDPLHAQIIPERTLDAAISELHEWRDMAKQIKTRGSA